MYVLRFVYVLAPQLKFNLGLPPSPQTRVVIFTRLPAGMVKERKSLELLIDTSVQRKLDYESFYFHEDMA